MNSQEKRELAKLHKRWSSSPLDFVREAFKAEPEPWQAEVLVDLPNYPKIAIKSGHGVGKTTLEAWAIIWFVLFHAPCKVPCTAPTAHQLKDILWPEIRKWLNILPDSISNAFELTSDRLSITEDVFAVARTARKENPDAFQGFHSENILFVVDEASGVEEVIFEVAQGALSTPGARVIMAGNPTKTSGYFYRAFHANRDMWKTYTVSCFDSSRVSPDYIENCKREYGEDSNFYRVRVLGEFPESGDMQFISTAAVDRCFDMEDQTWHAFPMVAGLDVARHGDDTSVFIIRQGRKVHEVLQWRIDDLTTLATKAAHTVRQYPQIKQLAIDTVGMGQGVYDMLGKQGFENILQPVNAGAAAFESDKFLNLRAEMWFKMRSMILEGMDLPRSERMMTDLTGLQYDYDAKQRLRLEKKSDMKKRGLPSPDIGDALAMTYAYDLGIDEFNYHTTSDYHNNHKGYDNDFEHSYI